MFKKIVSLLFVCAIASISTLPISANADAVFPLPEEIEIVNEMTFKDNNEQYYYFESSQDMEVFLQSINQMNGISNYACTPADVGYPNCNSNPVVRVESVLVSTSISGWITNNTLLLENWTYGGAYGATMSVTSSKSVSFSFDGCTVSIGTGTSQTFTVPPYKQGNVKYSAKLSVKTYQQYYILKDGTRQVGSRYKTATKYEGMFAGVYR